MSKQENFLLAGFGGQGILFAGKLLAYIGLIDGKEVSWLPSYGPEMRGGTCNCSVCVSKEPIGSPMVAEPEVLAVMNTPSCAKFIPKVVSGGIVFMDSFLCDYDVKRTDITLVKIPATKIAREEKLDKMANVILVGKMIKTLGLTSEETIKKAFDKVVGAKKPELLEANLKAIKLGLNF